MNKSEFVEKLSKELSITKIEGNKKLNEVLSCIAESLKDSDELRFVGFGTFKGKNVEEKRVKTPMGKMATVPAQRRVSFSVGSEFKKIINKK
ncbi:MAG: nucleoid DNA-binding protein [Candidatus Midichloriaceae bacterium]|jgi:nucleoid DNA-binding protein